MRLAEPIHRVSSDRSENDRAGRDGRRAELSREIPDADTRSRRRVARCECSVSGNIDAIRSGASTRRRLARALAIARFIYCICSRPMRLTPCRCVIIRIMRGNMPQYCSAIGSRTPGDETVLQGVRGGAHRSLAGWITGWNYGALELRKGFTFDRCKRSYRLGGPAYPAARLSERERERERERKGRGKSSICFFFFSFFLFLI